MNNERGGHVIIIAYVKTRAMSISNWIIEFFFKINSSSYDELNCCLISMYDDIKLINAPDSILDKPYKLPKDVIINVTYNKITSFIKFQIYGTNIEYKKKFILIHVLIRN